VLKRFFIYAASVLEFLHSQELFTWIFISFVCSSWSM